MKRFAIAIIVMLISWVNVAEANAAATDFDPLLHTEIIIDAGHGGIDGGAHYGDLLEKTINLDVSKKLYELLKSRKYNVVLNRDGDYALSEENRWLKSKSRHTRDLAHRKQLSVEIPSQVLISLHVNWAKDKTERGPLVFYQRHDLSFMLAHQIQDTLNLMQGTSTQPRSGKKYYLLRYAECPAVIVEMGFLSNYKDRAMLTDPSKQDEIARAVASGVQNYLLMLKQ